MIAGFLGWTFDAFDFFILTYVMVRVARDFHRSHFRYRPHPHRQPRQCAPSAPSSSVSWPTAMAAASRSYSISSFTRSWKYASGLAPSYTRFPHPASALRHRHGRRLGSRRLARSRIRLRQIARHSLRNPAGRLRPRQSARRRRLLDSLPRCGWRPYVLHRPGSPALLTLSATRVNENEAWKATAAKNAQAGRAISANSSPTGSVSFISVLLMAMMNFLSHGTQDLYPTFLQQQTSLRLRASPPSSAVISMLGAITGGRSSACLPTVSAVAAPWSPPPSAACSSFRSGSSRPASPSSPVGAFLMQFMVQGAWASFPRTSTNFPPTACAASSPASAYQVGVLIAAPPPPISKPP